MRYYVNCTIYYLIQAENRLVSAGRTGLTASYAYDARGSRKSKTVDGATKIFVANSARREILDYDGGDGAIQFWNQLNGCRGDDARDLYPGRSGLASCDARCRRRRMTRLDAGLAFDVFP